MTNSERLTIADQRWKRCRDALVGFALYHLPDRIRKRFTGDDGREVFEAFVVAAIFGNRTLPPELEGKFGEVARRAHSFLTAIPRFRKLLDAEHDACMEWVEADDRVEQDEEDYGRSIQETYDMIEREMWDDIRDECKELGLVS